MTDGLTRDRWVDEVFRTPQVSAEVKVFLLWLERYAMDANGRIEEPREELAVRLGCHPRKVSAKFTAAVETGLLRQAVRGHRTQSSVYEAALPSGGGPVGKSASDRHSFQDPEGEKSAETRHPEGEKSAGFYHPFGAGKSAETRHPEGEKSADTRHPFNEPPYKDPRAGAHSNADRSNTTGKPSGHDEATVIRLFDEELEPSLRSNKPARKRAEPSAIDDLFEVFYKIFPRHKAKPEARKAWNKAIKNGADPDELIDAATRFAEHERRIGTKPNYIPYPASWLNKERWNDELDEVPAQASNGDYQPYRNPTDTSGYHDELRAD